MRHENPKKPPPYWRRRAVAALLLVVLLVALAALADWMGDGFPAASRAPLSARLVATSQRYHVVRPGDTLWSIARTVQPEGDVRPVVHRLVVARRGAALRPGERIAVP